MNIFEKIVAGEIPCNKVHENESYLAFHDISPKAPIHILAIPKKCYTSFQDVPPDVMAGLASFIQEVAHKVGLDQCCYRIISNIGQDGGQEVPHLHFHILGGGRLSWGDFREHGASRMHSPKENDNKKSL